MTCFWLLFYSSFRLSKKTLFSLNFIEYKSYSIFLMFVLPRYTDKFFLCRSVFYWYSDFCSVFFFFCWRIAWCIACPGTHWISIDTGLLAASSDSKSSNKAVLHWLCCCCCCVGCACPSNMNACECSSCVPVHSSVL